VDSNLVLYLSGISRQNTEVFGSIFREISSNFTKTDLAAGFEHVAITPSIEILLFTKPSATRRRTHQAFQCLTLSQSATGFRFINSNAHRPRSFSNPENANRRSP
jgi:hypothetical protein